MIRPTLEADTVQAAQLPTFTLWPRPTACKDSLLSLPVEDTRPLLVSSSVFSRFYWSLGYHFSLGESVSRRCICASPCHLTLRRRNPRCSRSEADNLRTTEPAKSAVAERLPLPCLSSMWQEMPCAMPHVEKRNQRRMHDTRSSDAGKACPYSIAIPPGRGVVARQKLVTAKA